MVKKTIELVQVNLVALSMTMQQCSKNLAASPLIKDKSGSINIDDSIRTNMPGYFCHVNKVCYKYRINK